ncbi:MAG TPA: site-specific integrase [Bacteroidia bacterium]|jgi:integrase|nr:site-specific integrase [Bacteroidia bacterium]
MIAPMTKIKPLQNPKGRGDFGLKVDCSFCDTLVSGCRFNGKSLESCPHPECLSYKVIGYDKETGKRRTKNLTTRIYEEALEQARLFQNELKETKKPEIFTPAPVEIVPPKIEKETTPTPLLVNEMASYMAYLRGADSVPEHKRRARCESHCKNVENHFFAFINSIKDEYKVKGLGINEVTDDMVGKFHKSILARNLSPRTYNKSIGTLQTFFNYLKKSGKINTNPFYGVLRKPETHKISVLTKEEFEALVEAVQKPELGKRKVGTETKDYYRDWILPAIKIGIMSGRRSEETIRAKWSDIETNQNNEMLSLSVIDYKVSRQQNRLQDNPKRISVPITAELKEVLEQLEYSKFKGTDRYIIGNDEPMDRNTMKTFLGRAFSHYWEQTEYSKNKKASYKILRKTYLSSLSASIGISNTQVISQHSDTKVLQEHYVSAQVLGTTAKNFSVFSKTEERQAELNKLRKSNNGLSLEK